MIPERRQHARLHFRLRVGVDTGHELFDAETGDIGEGGVFINTTSLIPIDTEIRLTLNLDGQLVSGLGRVTWQLTDSDTGWPSGVGVEFVSFSVFGQQAIRDWVAKHAYAASSVAAAAVVHPGVPTVRV